jgi:hypothetical protein
MKVWLLAALLPLIFIPSAFGYTSKYCFEDLPDGTTAHTLCGLTSGNLTQTFLAPNQPLESILPGFSLVIFWGGVIAIIWFKTERIDLVGIVGILVSATATGLSAAAIGIGNYLLLISLGILLFQVIRQRVTLFT